MSISSTPIDATTLAELASRLDSNQSLTTRKQALVDLLQLSARSLRGYLQSRLVVEDDLDDLLQETWLTGMQKVLDGSYHCDKGDPVSYLIGIAQNKLRQSYRKSQSTSLPMDAEIAAPEDTFEPIDVGYDLDIAASTLTDPEEQTVFAAIRAGKSISDIASMLGYSYKTAWRRWHRVVDHCQNVLREEVPADVRD